jgi:hypothetical protein
MSKRPLLLGGNDGRFCLFYIYSVVQERLEEGARRKRCQSRTQSKSINLPRSFIFNGVPL